MFSPLFGRRNGSRERETATIAVILPVLLMLVAPAAVLGQATGAVSGAVSEATSGTPLESAQVFLVGTDLGTITNSEGQFTIRNVPAGNYRVRVRHIGHQRQTKSVQVEAGARAQVNFSLETEALGLEEIVVTGTAGGAERRSVGNSMTSLDASQLPEASATSTSELLQGQSPGITVSSVGANVGQGQKIRLRGNTSVSMSNQPLIYIDGIRVRSEGYPHVTAPDYRAGRGANVTASPLNDIPPEAIQRIEIIKGAAATTLYGTEASAGVIQVFTKSGSEGGTTWSFETNQGTSWADKFGTEQEPHLFMDPYLRTTHSQEYAASVRGGSQSFGYFVNGSFSDREGVLPLDEGQKLATRANFSFEPTNNLQLQWNTSYTNDEFSNTPVGNNAQGLTLNAFRRDRNYFGDGSVETVSQLLEFDIQTHIKRLITGGTATYAPSDQLTNRFTVGYDLARQEKRQVRPFGFVFLPQGGVLNNQWQHETLTFDYVGTYSFDLTSDLISSFSWGGQSVNETTVQVEAWGENLPGPGTPTVSSASRRLGWESRQRVVNAGFFFQNKFDLQNRYFLTVGLRVDGNSAFGDDFGLQPYPKVSASWIASDEDFWPGLFDQFKLRAAYGQSGRAPGAFDAVRTWSPVGYAGEPAFEPNNVGNPNLGPERTVEIEGGFDASLFDGRLTTDFTYYRQTTQDALLNVRQMPSQGFLQSQLENVGKLRNTGIELSISGSPIRNDNLSWSLDLSLSTNSSEVLDIGNASAFTVASHAWIEEGHPAPVMRGRKVMNPDEVAEPQIEEEFHYGPNQPTRVFGLGTTVSLPSGLSLSARGEYNGGHYIYDTASLNALNRTVRWPLCADAYNKAGVGPAELSENVSKLTAMERMRCVPQNVDSDFLIYDADFFKMRHVTLQVPVDFAVPWASSADLDLSVRNFFSWQEQPIFDPEMSGNTGVHSSVNAIYERIPAPVSGSAQLRIVF